ncbi:hypothetical protein BH10CYA1_BH10CYA1_50400 [soil metagenome]
MQSKDNLLNESDQSEPLTVHSEEHASELVGAAALISADQFENYQLLSLIHSGATGDVFKVKRIGLDKLFALKVFKPDLKANLGADERFERESKSIATLTHENLSAAYEFGKSSKGTPFIVTDFIDGINLEQLVQAEGALNDARVLEISLQLCSLLDYLEQKGIAARGMDLSDVLMTKNETSTEVIKVVDLGIAKFFESTAFDAGSKVPPVQTAAGSDSKLTMESLTNSFSHPDVRMLGGLMFKLLIGKSLDQYPNPTQVLIADDPARATRIVLNKDDSELKRDLRLVAAGALQMPAVTHYRTIQDLHRALEKVSKGESLTPVKKNETSCRRKKILVGISGIAIASALIFIPFLSHNSTNNAAATKTAVVPVAQPKTYTGSQQIKDKFGRVLYASDASDQSACVNEALRLGINLPGAQLTNVQVGGVRVENTNLANANFKDCTLFAWTVSNVNLDGSTFSGCKLTRMKFNNDTFASANFKDCKLNSTSFTDSKMRGVKFEDCQAGGSVRKAKLSGVTFKSSELNGIHLLRGNWSNSKLLSPMPDALATFSLSNSIISCTSLHNADFSGATVSSSKIIAPDAKSLKFKSLRDTTVEQKMPGVEKMKVGEVK